MKTIIYQGVCIFYLVLSSRKLDLYQTSEVFLCQFLFLIYSSHIDYKDDCKRQGANTQPYLPTPNLMVGCNTLVNMFLYVAMFYGCAGHINTGQKLLVLFLLLSQKVIMYSNP